ncbi:hypothetical protein [Halorussus sp. MSC15.2]|uniref:DUF7282 domain-containing protein n=1 Tax=Halorussus sp. MSC15.2 TaxID=2283638 RepID=UPI0013D8251E|nr:hypothetical protein [Halorussus sp. MSC15.2]NEU56392.1 hypothetical protein [Halorussus sp. MSC15.2]
MSSKSERRHTTVTLLVAALLVVGAGAVTTQATTSDDATALQETTTATVNQQANVTIQNLTAPERVRVGTNYTVSATVENRAGETVTNRVSYQIAGNVIAAQLVQIPTNGTQTVVFNVTEEDTEGFPTGTFVHGVFTESAAATANLTLVEATADTTTTETTTTVQNVTPTATTVENTTTAATTQATTTEETVQAEVTATETVTTAEETTTVTETETTTTTTTENATATARAEVTTTETTVTQTETATPTTTETATPTATETATATVTENATPTATTTQAEARTAHLTFERQNSNGSTVTVQSVTVPDGGFVVVHDTGVIEGEVVESIVGVSDYLEPGTHRNVTVELAQPLNQSQRLVSIAYRDSNDNQEFDFVTSNRTADGPYTKVDSKEAVNAIAVIDVNETATNATTTEG